MNAADQVAAWLLRCAVTVIVLVVVAYGIAAGVRLVEGAL